MIRPGHAINQFFCLSPLPRPYKILGFVFRKVTPPARVRLAGPACATHNTEKRQPSPHGMTEK